MFNSSTPLSKAEQTRARILQTALQLFREKGFDATTMRDIAAACGMAVGTAYHHFESKEAIVASYYDWVQEEHLRRVRSFCEQPHTLRERLDFAMQSKLDIVQDDQKLLGVVMRYAGEREHPLSIFGPQTLPLRQISVETFRVALGDESLPPELTEVLPLLLWALHMGLLLYFLHDASGGQKSRELSAAAVGFALQVLGAVKLPLILPVLRPFLKKFNALLRTYGLWVESASVER